MPPKWDEMAIVGRVARAHGIRGQVIVQVETDFPLERFRPGAELFINRGGVPEPITLTTARFHRERPVIGIGGVDDMNGAQALAGTELRIPRERLVALPAGTFYHHDLVGCSVETRAGESLGVVEKVEGTWGGSRLVVGTPRGEILVPLADPICSTIDLAARRIVIDPPEGLVDLNLRRPPGGEA